MSHKIGIGVITHNREKFFTNCINSIPEVDTIVVINDGVLYSNELYPKKIKEVIQHTTNKGVGISKNEALRYLIQDNCKSLFLCEDDMLIVDKNICTKYIHAAEKSGIWHLNFAYHGPGNMTPDGRPNPRATIDYDDVKLSFNMHCVGAWSYYLTNVIKNVGYIDEHFKNAHDHTEHTYRIVKAGLTSPWWWFADRADSTSLINEQASSINNTTIPHTEQWKQNYFKACAWFKYKHNYAPTEIPDTPKEAVLSSLEVLQKNYSRKVI